MSREDQDWRRGEEPTRQIPPVEPTSAGAPQPPRSGGNNARNWAIGFVAADQSGSGDESGSTQPAVTVDAGTSTTGSSTTTDTSDSTTTDTTTTDTSTTTTTTDTTTTTGTDTDGGTGGATARQSGPR